jgi:hypothetical protein
MKMAERFSGIGYEIVEYRGFFGHEGYYKKLPWLRNCTSLFQVFFEGPKSTFYQLRIGHSQET